MLIIWSIENSKIPQISSSFAIPPHPMFFLPIFSLSPILLFTSSPSHCSSSSIIPSPSNGQSRKLKILIFSPQIGFSHLQFAGAVADSLADAGHEVHILEILFNSHWRNFTNFRHPHRIIRIMPDPAEFPMNVLDLKMFSRAFDGQFNAVFDGIWSEWWDYWPFYCKVYLKQDAVLAELAREHYDVGITELYDFCPLAIFHHAGIPMTAATSATPLFQYLASHFGVPILPSFMTSGMAPVKNGPYLGFSERVFNFYGRIYEKLFLLEKPYDKEQILINQKFGPNFPSLALLARNVSYLFVNVFDHYDLPRPTVQKIVNIGGIVENNTPIGQIDSESDRIFANSGKGVIYFSMGSSPDLSLMSATLKRALLHTFGQFPDYQFIWKMDQNSSAGSEFDSVPNLHLLSWVNQRAVLAHPKLAAFITHCGRNSLNEAAIAGIPVVALPLFADQPYNAMTARHKGVAEFVDIVELSQNRDLLVKALQKVLTNPKYRLAALDLRRRIELSPFSPAQKLVGHIEFAAEFRGGILTDMDLPTEDELGGFLIYHSLDVILVSTVLFCALLTTLFVFIKCAIRFCWKWRRTNSKEKFKHS